MRRRRARPEEDTSIDMTPMLDIVFIMLIFFIVTATFVKESGIDVTRPDAETSVKQSRVGILIAINDNNEVWINRRQVELAAVRANVERLHLVLDCRHRVRSARCAGGVAGCLQLGV